MWSWAFGVESSVDFGVNKVCDAASKRVWGVLEMKSSSCVRMYQCTRSTDLSTYALEVAFTN